MYFHKTPRLVQLFYPNLIWQIKTSHKDIYLTFDDGPIPDVTTWVLEELNRWQAKATFFLVGENIVEYPEIYDIILADGHAVGNHTHNHLNGWQHKQDYYLKNIVACDNAMNWQSDTNKLFRPPYGRISFKLARILAKTHKIIMWDVLSGDFDLKIPAEICLKKSINATENGSIIVFHDNIKTGNTLKYVLPRYLKHFSERGYQFKAIN